MLLGVVANLKRAVAVVAKSGPALDAPVDMDLATLNFPIGGRFDLAWRTATAPAAGDVYIFDVLYEDGTQEEVSGPLSGVIIP